MRPALWALAAGISVAVGCAGHADFTGRPTDMSSGVQGGGGARAAVRYQAPMEALGVYLDGLHFRNGKMEEQMEAHHYCSALSDDLIQCVLFNGNDRDSHLIGVEYVVSGKAFAALPGEEKSLWHSHRYEVKSGQLVAPGLSDSAEHELMAKLISTYGKTWHTWAEGSRLPLGPPALMMGFTADGQAQPELAEKRDRAFGLSSAAKKSAREDIPATEILPGADAWQKGDVVQVKLGRE